MSVRPILSLVMLLLASPAAALPLAFTGTQQIRFDSLGVLASAAGSGVSNVNTGVVPASFTLPASIFAFAQGFAIPSSQTLDVGATNGAGSFMQGTGGFGGVMPLLGALSIGIPVTIVTTTPSSAVTTTTVTVALAFDASPLGGGASATATTSTGGQSFAGTLVGGAFGTGTVAGVAGFDNRIAGVGVLQMVAPVSIVSDVMPGGQADGVVVLTLNFVPEPSTGLLCGLGAIGFGLIGRQRRKGLR